MQQQTNDNHYTNKPTLIDVTMNKHQCLNFFATTIDFNNEPTPPLFKNYNNKPMNQH
jgi:hypothetical protein